MCGAESCLPAPKCMYAFSFPQQRPKMEKGLEGRSVRKSRYSSHFLRLICGRTHGQRAGKLLRIGSPGLRRARPAAAGGAVFFGAFRSALKFLNQSFVCLFTRCSGLEIRWFSDAFAALRASAAACGSGAVTVAGSVRLYGCVVMRWVSFDLLLLSTDKNVAGPRSGA